MIFFYCYTNSFFTLATLAAQANTFSADADAAAKAAEALNKSQDQQPANASTDGRGSKKTRAKKAKEEGADLEPAAHLDERPVKVPSYTGRPPNEVLSAAGLAFREVHKEGPVSNPHRPRFLVLTLMVSSDHLACPVHPL
jgi:hypothetical protein